MWSKVTSGAVDPYVLIIVGAKVMLIQAKGHARQGCDDLCMYVSVCLSVCLFACLLFVCLFLHTHP